MDTYYFYKLLQGVLYTEVFIFKFSEGGMPPDPSLAKPEPPVTMMLSHFLGGNPELVS